MDHDALQLFGQNLSAHLDEDPCRPPVGGMGVFHCRAPQVVRAVPFHVPCVILVVRGGKTVVESARELRVKAGELLLFPAGCSVEMGNRPDADGVFLSVAVAFDSEVLAQFRQQYAAALQVWKAPPMSHSRAPRSFVTAIAQWFDWCRHATPDPVLQQHRLVELLLLLARDGLAGRLLLDTQPGWCQRVAQLVSLDLAHPWQVGEVSSRLGVGQSSLRRLLAEEGSGFRKVLEEARLVAGLSLLQETFWPVNQVALAVGYQSHSRFSERFKQRFGVTPAALRQTRVSVSGEVASA